MIIEKMNNLSLNISTIVPISEVNGPGPHYCIWVQGCCLKCKNCFNPSTHDPKKGKLILLKSLINDIKKKWKSGLIKGVTITGGEPLDQLPSLVTLVLGIKKIGDIGVIILTGYEEEELNKMIGFEILRKYADVIIFGRFEFRNLIQKGLRGSRNKKYYINSHIYSIQEFDSIPQLEVLIKSDGELMISGIEPEIVITDLYLKE